MALVMGLVVVWFLFGTRIMNGLYAAGLMPHPTVEEVQKELIRHAGPGRSTVTCQPGSDGWEFFCEVEHWGVGGYHYRQKYAILSSWISKTQWEIQLKEGDRIPSVTEYFKGKRKPY